MKRVIVVGAGLAGAATAFGLRERGLDPLVLERGAAAGLESSSRSAQLVRSDVEDDCDPLTRSLVEEGARIHRTGRFARFRRTGALIVGRGDEDASRWLPFVRGRARWQPDDGVVDAGELLRSFLHGARVRYGARVGAIEPGRGGLRVVLDGGESLAADVVVNAAGAWAGVLGGLELEPRKRHLFRTTPRGASPDWPWAWDEDAGLYFRPDEGGSLLLCACDERAVEPGDNAVDLDVERTLREKVERAQRGLLPLEIATTWAGQRTFAPDGRFVIGWDERVEGLFHVAGLGGHGVTVAPAAGALAAARVVPY